MVGLAVENKSGRGLLRAACFVDATGDADLARRAGAECAPGESFTSIWAFQAAVAQAQRVAESGQGIELMDAIRLAYNGEWFDTAPERRRWDAADGKEVSHFVLETHRLVRVLPARAGRGVAKPAATAYPLQLPPWRSSKTWRIVGQATLRDGQDGQRFEDSIGLVADWRRPGPVWEIPTARWCRAAATVSWLPGAASRRPTTPGGDAGDPGRRAHWSGRRTGRHLAVRAGTTPVRCRAEVIQAALQARGIPYHLRDLWELPGGAARQGFRTQTHPRSPQEAQGLSPLPANYLRQAAAPHGTASGASRNTGCSLRAVTNPSGGRGPCCSRHF